MNGKDTDAIPRPDMLYITDMDGTLLDADAHISQASRAMLRTLVNRGIAVTVATARTPATVQPLLEGTSLHLPCIVMTGAALWHPRQQQYSDVHFISADQEEILDRTFATHGVYPFICTLTDSRPIEVYINTRHLSNHQRKYVEERASLPLKRFYLDCMPPQSQRGHRVLYFGMGPLEQVRKVADALAEASPCAISCYPDTYTPGLGLIEVFAPGVSKASAVLALKKKLGAHSITVFGDNLNDIPMLRVADHPVAVANAAQPVLDIADTIIGPNTTDAVPRYILEHSR